MRTLPFCTAYLAFGAFIFFSDFKILPCFFFILFLCYSLYHFKDKKIALACLLFVFSGFLNAFCDDLDMKAMEKILEPYRGKSITLYCRVTSVKKNNSSITAESEVYKVIYKKKEYCLNKKTGVLLFLQDSSDVSINDSLVIKGSLEKISSTDNPNIFSYSEFMNKKNIFYCLKNSKIISISLSKIDSLYSFALFIKRKAFDGLLKNHDYINSSIICGVVFGDRSLFTDDLTEIFRRSGTFHLLAASGFNISIISSFFFFIFKKFRIGTLLSLFIVLPFIILYVFMAGMSPSIIRAAIMSCVSFFALSLNREYDLPSALSMSAFCMISFKPSFVCDCGFQLSVGAVIGICAYAYIIRPYMQGISGILKIISESFMISFCAELVTVPLCAYWFSSWVSISFISNIFAAPLAAMILTFGLIESLFIILYPDFSFLISFISDFFTTLMYSWNSFASSLPFSFIEICSPSETAISIYFLVAFFILKLYRGKFNILILTILPTLLILYSYIAPVSSNGAECVFFDVGDADSCLFITEEGRTILIDCGTSGNSGGIDVGKRIIAPYLFKRGFKTLDFVFLTHSHDDHFGGFQSLSNKIEVQNLMISPFMKKIKNARIISAGDRIYISPSVYIDVIYPSYSEKGVDENNSSLVLLVNISKTKFLMCGDIEKEAEEKIISRNINIKADVIKVAHHGSSTSSSKEFIKRAMPSIAVISCGRNNKKGHPSKDTLDSFKSNSCRIIETSKSGAIRFININNGKYDLKLGR